MSDSPSRSLRTAAMALSLAALCAATVPASAADFVFTGTTDSGPLAGQAFSGSFSFAGAANTAEGDQALTAFTLSFAGQTWQLGDLNAGAFMVFTAGQPLGLALSAPGDGAVVPDVEFVPGFADFSEAHFAYKPIDLEGMPQLGFGSYTLTDVTPAVPEPASVALLLAGLGVVGLRAVRRA